VHQLRGFIDNRLGVRGFGEEWTKQTGHEIHSGDVLDFWRVYMLKEEGKLVLYAEMKLPGQAWLEFKIINNTLYQAATFKPRGVWGKLYWYLYYFHGFILTCSINL
jgi:hypothetical protein